MMFYKEILNPVREAIGKYGARNAFFIDGMYYTYRQLAERISAIRSVIRAAEKDEKIWGLALHDDLNTYASIFALWMEGKAYVPLNPNQPKERHHEVIKSVGTHYILSSDVNYNPEVEGVNVISTAEVSPENTLPCGGFKPVNVPDSNIAYILFTSGSTGKPKGVQITRGDLSAFIDSMDNIGLDITEKDRCLQPFDLTFDFSVSSYVIPLAKGASIYTIPNKATKFTYIAELLEEYHLTVLQMVPSMIRNLLPYMDEVDVSSVRYNILCGEALMGKVIKAWHQANPEMISYNMYGPTEDTVFCTYYLIDKNNTDNLLASNDIVSIGKTFKNSGVLLVGEKDEVISQPNMEGELCLCGDQLTPGYWKNEKENTEKFFVKEGVRYYRTGDLCYYAEDGNLMYVSRKDFQVKINGFRVELGEIENRYAALSGGRYAVVLPYLNEQGNTELAIVIEGAEYDVKEHRTALANTLPAYEVPAQWLFIRNIPLNQNGKVVRRMGSLGSKFCSLYSIRFFKLYFALGS